MITNPLPAPSSRIHTLAIRYRQPIFAGMKTNRSAKYVTSSIFCTCMRAYSAETEAENIRNIKWETLGFTNHIAHAHTHILRWRRIHFSLLLFTFRRNRSTYICVLFSIERTFLICMRMYELKNIWKFQQFLCGFICSLAEPNRKYASQKIVENNIRTFSTSVRYTSKKHWHKISISSVVVLSTLWNLLNMHGIKKVPLKFRSIYHIASHRIVRSCDFAASAISDH